MAVSNDELAQWAASFLALQLQSEPMFSAASGDESLTAITASARDLLRTVDAGGVPAFMTNALKQIAQDNDIALTTQSTPNDVIDALRARCTTCATSHPTNFD